MIAGQKESGRRSHQTAAHGTQHSRPFPYAFSLAWGPDVKQPGRHEPKKAHLRKYAEECQYGDVVEWLRPPKVRDGMREIDAPSARGVVSVFVGPHPHRALVRFFVRSDVLTEPMVVVCGQPLRVVHAR